MKNKSPLEEKEKWQRRKYDSEAKHVNTMIQDAAMKLKPPFHKPIGFGVVFMFETISGEMSFTTTTMQNLNAVPEQVASAGVKLLANTMKEHYGR